MIRLDDVILLVEQGLGRKHQNWIAFPTESGFQIRGTSQDTMVLLWIKERGNMEAFRPFERIEHAMMIARKLGITLSPQWDVKATTVTDKQVLIGWAAGAPQWDDDGDPEPEEWGQIICPNNEAAQAMAICECALKILRARPEVK